MKSLSCKLFKSSRLRLSLTLFLALSVITGGVSSAPLNNLVRYAVSDVRVVYVFDDPQSIDWPVIYYLNGEYGCHIDLLSIDKRASYWISRSSITDREIDLLRFHYPADEAEVFDSLVKTLFPSRIADIVIFGEDALRAPHVALQEYLTNLSSESGSLFPLLKIYRGSDRNADTSTGQAGSIILNRTELRSRYIDRINAEVPQLFSWYHPADYKLRRLGEYRLELDNLPPRATRDSDFLSGIPISRLKKLLEDMFDRGPMRKTLKRQAGLFITGMKLSSVDYAPSAIDAILRGYQEIMNIRDQVLALPVADSLPEFAAYIDGIANRSRRAALRAAGVRWDDRIIIRESPHGPKVKYRIIVSADGPRGVELQNIFLSPHWDTAIIVLDSQTHFISPHQSFEREYLIDIDRKYMEGKAPESLVVTAMASYGQIPLKIISARAIWVAPDLSISFEPNFQFVPPVGDVDIDRVVSSRYWRANIVKPRSLSAKVSLELKTPHGVYAGAYRTSIDLDEGSTQQTVRIPFTISKLLELGVHQQTITLSMHDHVVAADTALIRIASCKIADTITIGLLPDTSGMLEDILNMTEATYRPLTNRALVTSDLDAYNVILIGSGALRAYPSIRDVKDRLHAFVREGGSIVVFGQNEEDWMEGFLPVSITVSVGPVTEDMISNRIPGANILRKPYRISDRGLLSSFYRSRDAASAVIIPSERIYVLSDGSTLLAVSRMGQGQIIYCGLPLLEMISRLEIEAIHLFSNILNY